MTTLLWIALGAAIGAVGMAVIIGRAIVRALYR